VVHRAFAKAASLLLDPTLYYMIRPSSVFTVINTFAGLESGLESPADACFCGSAQHTKFEDGFWVWEVPLWLICFLPERTIMTVDGRGLLASGCLTLGRDERVMLGVAPSLLLPAANCGDRLSDSMPSAIGTARVGRRPDHFTPPRSFNFKPDPVSIVPLQSQRVRAEARIPWSRRLSLIRPAWRGRVHVSYPANGKPQSQAPTTPRQTPFGRRRSCISTSSQP
jgi:hypothetical protein